MIRTLVREDPAYRNLAKWLIFTILSATVVLNITTFHAKQAGGEALPDDVMVWYAALAWLMVTVYLVFGHVRTRCTPFGMSLPISSRSLWTAHITAVILGGFVLLVSFVAVAIGGSRLLKTFDDLTVFSARDASAATIHVASLFVLGAVLLELRGPSERTIRQGARQALIALAAATVMFAVVLAMMSTSLAVAVVPVIAAVVLGARRFQALPESFSLSPDRAEAAVASPEGIRAWVPAKRSPLSRWWLVTSVVYRSTINKRAAPIITAPFLLFLGLLLAGMDRVWASEELRAMVVPITAYVLMAVILDPFLHIFRVDAFPISRRRVFALLIVPCLLLLALGYGAGRFMLGTGIVGSESETICFCKANEGYYYTHVPIGFCQVSWGDDIPANDSQWGESHEPWSAPVFKGSPVKFYSPFSVGEGASIDFAALQISRATEAIFGEAITPEEIKRRYLRERSDGSAALAVDELTIQRDFPHLRPRHVGPVFPILFMLVSVLWFAAVRVFASAMRAGNSKRKRMSVGFLVMAGLFAIYILVGALAATHLMQLWSLVGLFEILARQIGDAFPGGELLVWLVCLAITAVGYLWAERRFLRIEAVLESDRAGSSS